MTNAQQLRALRREHKRLKAELKRLPPPDPLWLQKLIFRQFGKPPPKRLALLSKGRP